MGFIAILITFILGGLIIPPAAIYGFFIYISAKPKDPAAHIKLTSADAKSSLESSSTFKTQNNENDHDLDIDESESSLELNSVPEVAAGFFKVVHHYDPLTAKEISSKDISPQAAAAEQPQQNTLTGRFRSAISRQSVATVENESRLKELRKTISRKAGIFYVVLKLRHLMLFDDEDQIEAAHIFAIDNYDVDIYGGATAMAEGELFVKRTSLRLRPRPVGVALAITAKELHFLTDNCSLKEDLYLALLKAQRQPRKEITHSLLPLSFEPDHMTKLIQLLHSSGANLQTRWLNALVGRLWLSLYHTTEMQDKIRAKITKKLTRVRTPAFLTKINIVNVNLGDSAPMLSNPKLRELTIDGDVTVELDIAYSGNFRLDIATTARLDLGPRFKVRETPLVLAGTMKNLKGRLLARIKPPPSNRIWISFETMPTLDINIEPVVSNRQITYGPILRILENKVRDVMRETLVLPNWDDIPFIETENQPARGGLWRETSEQDDSSTSGISTPSRASTLPPPSKSEPDLTLSQSSTLVDPQDLHTLPTTLRNTSTSTLSDEKSLPSPRSSFEDTGASTPPSLPSRISTTPASLHAAVAVTSRLMPKIQGALRRRPNSGVVAPTTVAQLGQAGSTVSLPPTLPPRGSVTGSGNASVHSHGGSELHLTDDHAFDIDDADDVDDLQALPVVAEGHDGVTH